MVGNKSSLSKIIFLRRDIFLSIDSSIGEPLVDNFFELSCLFFTVIFFFQRCIFLTFIILFVHHLFRSSFCNDFDHLLFYFNNVHFNLSSLFIDNYFSYSPNIFLNHYDYAMTISKMIICTCVLCICYWL